MYGLVSEGDPFKVFTRRGSVGDALVIRFECKEGMGVLGIRKGGRTEPSPAVAYEEEDIDPASLRAGRFVHVLPSGQRQSYALSRISSDVAGRLPSDRWVELKPHTEYGFRYLVAPEADLDGTTASIQVSIEDQPATVVVPPAPARVATQPVREPTIPVREPTLPNREATAPLPSVAEAALRMLSRDQAVDHLKAEMHKVHQLQQRVLELEESL
ncbi:MAG: hypothetical protein R3F59_15520 [Myxococcota bacterium]